jgi:hypothetical protein
MDTQKRIAKASKENILGASEGMSEPTRAKYLKFMELRFGDSYTSLDYAVEWKERIEAGKLYLMDAESLQAWQEASKV